MNTLTSTHLRRMAVVASVAINLLLIGALRAGFDVPAVTVVQLPTVTVIGKREHAPNAVVAQTAKPLPSSSDVKL